ncbi:ABC transporter substrate-binding protein [Glaciimonas sp. CA11.2]|uniref:ABC transporter substrate-binding protein n=1 Tax=unclassified Glaciimonas TaxID=2644401 RepID=UPI002AB56459|nr:MULTISPECIES: ABC transporter substrate-binding protein [unclassified Glaciimonas]MDY7546698.1 ABC transporter substrate-binding protein [Glaciimonas sp. CA11.2]MEB0011821.1 ABC transporter substrate-binding protein [Glaciimonas sp. Cout2]MEB0080623.1 ABC transporter substrate-binding protein [Glaciimonas sp. Gout2]MEB0162256.1 ABC transporter substrate-binding protein [Glaciimonas sp. CA11.2]
MKTNKKNNLLKAVGLFASALPLMVMSLPNAYAVPEDVKVALIVPLSGAWARNGELQRKGAEMAIDDINASGGIKALGGAKMRLVVADTGDSVEKAKNAIQRLLSQEPSLIGGSGAFLSSLTLAVTEVSERAELPWLSLSYSDQITNRGFKYVFQTSPIASVQAETVLPILVKLSTDSTGKAPKNAGIVMDNTASPASFTKGMRESGFAKYGINLITDQVYTPPLADATSLVQKLRNTRPDLAFMLTTNVPDTKLLLEKMNEMGVGSGKIPVVTNGGHMGAPELLKVVKKEMLEGVMVVVANWGGKGDEKLSELFKKRTGESWMTQDSLSTYGDMWIFKDALEKAGVADRKKVAAAIRSMDTSEGAAKYFAGGHLKFDEKGRRVGSGIVILQWRNGVPVPVYPASLAVAKPVWPKLP